MVQRYRPDSDEQGRSFEMIPDDGGDYVAYEDYEELEAEVGRLQMMNPCNHTGFESAPCDVCGYPDPRKMITKLKDERDAANRRWERARARYLNGADGCCCLFDKDEKQINWCSVHAELRAERDRLRERLETFADFILEECDEWALAHDAARNAKQALRGGEAK
jgi:hypothetical protein